MGLTAFEAALQLVERLDRAARADSIDAITESVKRTLEDLIARGELLLPERYHQPRPGGYARRLLHRNPELNYSAVVMTWSAQHATPLHDHGGMWCVEGVVSGEMQVRRFEATQQQGTRYQFREIEAINCGCGSCGRLIPPHDYHILGNRLADRPSITLHVYGGDMDSCSVFEARPDGWWQRVEKELTFDD